MALVPTSSHGGGDSPPTTRQEWSGNGVVISPNDFAWLPWNSTAGPDVVLDATIPAHPTVIAAGVYVVSVVVGCNGAAGATYRVEMHLDRQGFDASQTVIVWGAQVTGDANDASVAFAWYLPESAEVAVGVEYDTADASTASCSLKSAHIQRLS